MLLFSLNNQNRLQMPLLEYSINTRCSQSLFLNSPPQSPLLSPDCAPNLTVPFPGATNGTSKTIAGTRRPDTSRPRPGGGKLEKLRLQGRHEAPRITGMHLSLRKRSRGDGHPATTALFEGKRAFRPDKNTEAGGAVGVHQCWSQGRESPAAVRPAWGGKHRLWSKPTAVSRNGPRVQEEGLKQGRRERWWSAKAPARAGLCRPGLGFSRLGSKGEDGSGALDLPLRMQSPRRGRAGGARGGCPHCDCGQAHSKQINHANLFPCHCPFSGGNNHC